MNHFGKRNKTTFKLAFYVFILINSNLVYSFKQEVFSNITEVVNHRIKRNLIFQPGTRIMVSIGIKMFKKNTRHTVTIFPVSC